MPEYKLWATFKYETPCLYCTGSIESYIWEGKEIFTCCKDKDDQDRREFQDYFFESLQECIEYLEKEKNHEVRLMS